MAYKPPSGKLDLRNGSQPSLSRHPSSVTDLKNRFGSGASPVRKGSAAMSKENLIPGTSMMASPSRKGSLMDIDAPKLQVANHDFDLTDRTDSKSASFIKKPSNLSSTNLIKQDSADHIGPKTSGDFGYIQKSLMERAANLEREHQKLQVQESECFQRSLSLQAMVSNLEELETLARQREQGMWLHVPSVTSKREEQLEMDMEVLKARIRCLEQGSNLSSRSNSTSTLDMQNAEVAKLAVELSHAKEKSLSDAILIQQLTNEVTQLLACKAAKEEALELAEAHVCDLQKTICEFESQLSQKDQKIALLAKDFDQRVEEGSRDMLDLREALGEMEEHMVRKEEELARLKRLLEDERHNATDERLELQQVIQDLQVQNVEKQSQILLLQAQSSQQQDQRESDVMHQLRRALLDAERQALLKDAEILQLKGILQDERLHAIQVEEDKYRLMQQLESQNAAIMEDGSVPLFPGSAGDAALQKKIKEVELALVEKDAEIVQLKVTLESERLQQLEDERDRQKSVAYLELKVAERDTCISELQAEKEQMQQAKKDDTQELYRLQQIVEDLLHDCAHKDAEVARLKAILDESPTSEGTCGRRCTMQELNAEGPRKDAEIMKLRDLLEEERMQALQDMQQLQDALHYAEKKLSNKDVELQQLKTLLEENHVATNPGGLQENSGFATCTLQRLHGGDCFDAGGNFDEDATDLHEMIAALETAMANKDEELKALLQEKEELAGELAIVQDKLKMTEKDLQEKEMLLHTNDSQVGQPSEEDHTLDLLRAELVQKDALIVQLQQSGILASQEQHFKDLDERQRDQISWQREEICRYREEVARERAEKDRQREEIQILLKELDQLRQRVSDQSQALARKDSELFQLTLMSVKSEEEISSARASLEQANISLSESKNIARNLEEKDLLISQKEMIIQELEQNLCNLESTLQKQEAALNEQSLEIEELHTALDREATQRVTLAELQQATVCSATQSMDDEDMKATQVFEHVEPLASRSLKHLEQQQRWLVEEEEMSVWRVLRSLEEQSWQDIIDSQRMCSSVEMHSVQQHIHGLEQTAMSWEVDLGSTSHSSSSFQRRCSVPSFDDLPDPNSYPQASDSMYSQPDVVPTAVWLAMPSESSSQLCNSQSLSDSGTSLEDRFGISLLPKFNQCAQSSQDYPSSNQQSVTQPPKPMNANPLHPLTERQLGVQIPSKFIPKEYKAPMEYMDPPSARPVTQPIATAPSILQNVEQPLVSRLPPASFLQDHDEAASFAEENSADTSDIYARYSQRSIYRASPTAAVRSSSANPSSARGSCSDWSLRRSTSSAREHPAPYTSPGSSTGLFIGGLKICTHDPSLRPKMDKERERLEKIAAKQQKEERKLEKEREKKQKKEKEKAERKKDGRRGLLGLLS